MENSDVIDIKLDRSASKYDPADLAKQVGVLHLEGTFTRDGKQKRCIVDFDASDLLGVGRIVDEKPLDKPGP